MKGRGDARWSGGAIVGRGSRLMQIETEADGARTDREIKSSTDV